MTAGVIGAVEFQLDKSNYRGVLRALEEVSGVAMKYDQEGIKGTEQDVAQRAESVGSQQPGTVAIASTPDGAQVSIDGAFAGSTPRENSLAPGEHEIKIVKKGYADWERKVLVETGKSLNIDAQLARVIMGWLFDKSWETRLTQLKCDGPRSSDRSPHAWACSRPASQGKVSGS